MAKIDDSVKKKVPELRFPGFTDDWEERKLSDVANHRGGTAIEKYRSSSTEIRFIERTEKRLFTKDVCLGSIIR